VNDDVILAGLERYAFERGGLIKPDISCLVFGPGRCSQRRQRKKSDRTTQTYTHPLPPFESHDPCSAMAGLLPSRRKPRRASARCVRNRSMQNTRNAAIARMRKGLSSMISSFRIVQEPHLRSLLQGRHVIKETKRIPATP